MPEVWPRDAASRSLEELGQGWAINFTKWQHEKLGQFQMAVGRVYRAKGGVFSCQEYSRFPGNHNKQKAVQHLTLKLAVLIFNQLNHSLLKCKLYLNLHE